MKAQLVLHAWLHSRQPYAEGLALATEHQVPAQLLKLLAGGENAFTRRKLKAALEQVHAQLGADRPDLSPAAGAAAAPVASVGPVATEGPAPEPAALLELRAARVLTFRQACAAHAQLKNTPEGPQLKALAVRVKELFRLNQEQWDREDFYKTYGFFPPDTVVIALDTKDAAAVTKRRNTLRTYLAKGQRGTFQKQAAWRAELLELDRILAHG